MARTKDLFLTQILIVFLVSEVSMGSHAKVKALRDAGSGLIILSAES